ncbi:MAG TPA: hypothetical protein VMM60_18410 [Ilumatobacter sp.]|nr:hypothetical protein [Ilumatobacter sp.]
MGQLVGVVEKPSTAPGVVRYELNRTLSGMGHERFVSLLDTHATTPSSSLARQLLSTGKVASVHIHSNIVTVDLEKGFTSDGLADIVREMYRYWKPGVVPPVFEDVEPEESAADGGGEADGGVELSAAAKLVPPHLLERSRAARERWKANNG